MTYDNRDVKFSREGDLVLGDGDLSLATAEETLEQDIYNRKKTNDPDWLFHNNIGANLEDLRGMPNTKDTGTLGEDKIIQSLTYDNRINKADLEVDAVPLSAHKIGLYSTVQAGNIDLTVPFELRLE